MAFKSNERDRIDLGHCNNLKIYFHAFATVAWLCQGMANCTRRDSVQQRGVFRAMVLWP
jgi:hypothetical protein